MLAIAVVGLVVNLVAARILHAPLGREPQRLGRDAPRDRRPARLGRGRSLAAVVILDHRLGVRRPGGQRRDRPADPRQLVDDPARLASDPARGLAAGHSTSSEVGQAMAVGARGQARSTTSTCGRSPRASRRSPPTCSSPATPTATPRGASSRRMLARALRARPHHASGRPRGRRAAADRDGAGGRRRRRRMILRRDGYELSDDRERLDLDAIWTYLRTAYWSENVPRDVVERAIEDSLCARPLRRATARRPGSPARSPTPPRSPGSPTSSCSSPIAVAGWASGWSSGCSPTRGSRACARSRSRPATPTSLYERFGFVRDGERRMVRSVPAGRALRQAGGEAHRVDREPRRRPSRRRRGARGGVLGRGRRARGRAPRSCAARRRRPRPGARPRRSTEAWAPPAS